MMPLLWVLAQLVSYSLLSWTIFVVVVALAAYYGRAPGIVVGHVVIAGLIVALDISWIQSEIAAPGWNGSPDQDGVFLIGVFLRVMMINGCLFPVSLVSTTVASKRRTIPRHPGSTDLTRPC